MSMGGHERCTPVESVGRCHQIVFCHSEVPLGSKVRRYNEIAQLRWINQIYEINGRGDTTEGWLQPIVSCSTRLCRVNDLE